VNQVLDSDINLKLGSEATPEMVKAMEPDEIFVAVGSEPVKPCIPGIDRANVMDILKAHYHDRELGKKVVIIGAGSSGCELALTLLKAGREVVIIEQTDEIASSGNNLYKGALEELFLREKHLTCLMETSCMEITANGVKVKNKCGSEETIAADNVVYSVGMRPLRDLAESFYGIVYDVKMVGDCMGARRINEATHEGYFAGAVV